MMDKKKGMFAGWFIIVGLGVFCASNICFGQDGDSVAQLSTAVKNGPSLYRTPEAVEYFSRQQSFGALASTDHDAAIKSLRALVRLGDMGEQAKAALPTLIEMFPIFEHVVVKKGVHYTKGNGTLEDWVQTFLVTEKNKFSFSSPFIEYASISKCENWMEAAPITAILQKQMGKGGRIVDAVADITIILRVNAGACALSRITGVGAGNTKEEWKKWWQNSGVASAQLQPAASPSVRGKTGEMTIGGTYKIHLVTGDVLIGTVTAMDDTSMSFNAEGGRPYTFRTVLVDKYESTAVLATPAPKAPDITSLAPDKAVALTYEDLFSGPMNGKTLEISTQNGSIFRGVLVAAGPKLIRLNVDGMDVPISRNIIIKLVLISK